MLPKQFHDRRSEPRREADEEVTLVCGQTPLQAKLIDESDSGCRVRHAFTLPDQVVVVLRGEHRMASRMWTRSVTGVVKESGLLFR